MAIFALNQIAGGLQNIIPDDEINSISQAILERVTKQSLAKLLLYPERPLTRQQENEVEKIVHRLKKNEPLQYIFGETSFYGLKFNIDKRALIPRPETAELVEWVLNDNKTNVSKSILDIGTGSGCIAVTLAKKLPKSYVSAFDISGDALSLAKENAQCNNVQIDFEQMDIIHPQTISKKWDIIVSNPPYITEHEKDGMAANVLDYEPHQALFVSNNDPLIFYRSIAVFAKQHLKHSGQLFFEINRSFGKKTVDMLADTGFTQVELKQDISGNDRMIRCILNQTT